MVYMQNKDKNGEIQGFDEAFFFIAVSAITGLSSDIEPDTWFTRTIVLFVMFIGIFWLPPRVSEMLSLWQDRSPWPAEFEAESNQSHVLLIGDLHYTTLFEFLREFFCEDHGFTTVNTVVVVMSETSPSKEIAELLTDPSYVNRVKFVLGSPTSFSQLSKVQADRAQAIFLLSSKAAGADAEKEDAAKVMIALAIRKYLRTRGDAKRPVPIYAQVLLPETTLHLDYLTDHVICIEELRQGLLAQSVMVPGVASLLQLLTTSIPDNTTHQLVRAAQRSKQEWLAEYAESMSHEIYGTKLAQMFVGQKFHKVSQTIFARTGATLFALHTSDDKILISPRDYEIKGDETGFVIASDSLVSTEIAYLQEEAAVNVDSDGEDEQTPLIPGINISATKDAAKQISGSPLQKAAVIAETTMKTKVPFGKNVMDTLVVDVMESSAAEESDHGSVRSGKSVVSQHLEDLIDLGHTGKLGQLVGDLAHITVGAEDASSGKGKEPEESKAEETKVATKRAPLLFDPALQKPTEDAEAPKPDSPSPPALAPSKTLKGTLKGASSATLLTKPTTPVTPTVDGLPGDLAGHLVVCDTSGEFPSNIIYLVSCIRAAAASEITSVAETDEHNGKQPSSRFASLYEQISRSYNLPTAEPEKPGFSNNLPIVILSPASPGGAQAEDLKRFGNIYIVEGSPLSRADLARVRIHTAGSGIVLANREESLSAAADASKNASLASSDTSATATADAPALLSVLNIEALTYTNDEFFLSVEFIHRENMQFVGDTETIRINEVYAQAFLRPSFMAGRVYAPVMLDTLICQAYYNEFIPDLMQRLIFSHGNVVHALGTAKLQAAGIEGLVYEEGQGVEDSGHVFQVEVPERFYGRTYASLFAYCCFKHAAVPIGLYRTVTYHRQPLWYVMPNPSPKNVLRQSDRVYVIAAARPVLQ
ncbi:hypothetical protein FBU59_002456 [Linderina macrospora]|uniref:Uncharacterized protein n=1 Tax=Linderina macrospora TaxID=4868 RepID=A0ACC1JB40_9FUNG|nr:hypothetical protein FBU59_002456 [Linderina macrospora]